MLNLSCQKPRAKCVTSLIMSMLRTYPQDGLLIRFMTFSALSVTLNLYFYNNMKILVNSVLCVMKMLKGEAGSNVNISVLRKKEYLNFNVESQDIRNGEGFCGWVVVGFWRKRFWCRHIFIWKVQFVKCNH